MIRAFLAFVLISYAAPLHALSCMAPDIVWLYQQIKEDEADFFMVKGTVTLTEAPNYAEAAGPNRTEADTQARATGFALTASGFNAPFDRPVTVRSSCFASWCGSPEGLADETHFFAVQLKGDDLILDRGPCGGLVERWSEAEEDRLLKCHLNGACDLKGF